MDLYQGQCFTCRVGQLRVTGVTRNRKAAWVSCSTPRCNAGYSIPLGRIDSQATASDVDAAVRAFRSRKR